MLLVLVLCLALVRSATCQAPASPCPNVFSYVPRGGRYLGYIQAGNVGNHVHLQASFSSASSLTGIDVQPIENSNNYWVTFPPSARTLPLVNWIKVNNRLICSNQQGVPSYYNYNVQVEHSKSVSGTGYGYQSPFGQEISNTGIQGRISSSYQGGTNSYQSGTSSLQGGTSSFQDALEQFHHQLLEQHGFPSNQGAGIYRPRQPPPVFIDERPRPSDPVPLEEPTPVKPVRVTTQVPATTAAPTSAPALPAEDCGLTDVPTNLPLVYFGEPTTHGEWPWLAALYLYDNNSLICGGSLVDLSHIVTAAHCVVTLNSGSERKAEDMYVVLGKYDLTSLDETGNQEQDIERILVHDDYNHKRSSGDIALIKLNQPVRYTRFVRPICLWSKDHPVKFLKARKAFVAGWGHDELGNLQTEKPRRAFTPIVTNEECIQSNRDLFETIVNDRSMCAGSKNGTGPCRGDSGGGLMVANRERDDDNRMVTRFYLQGVVSLGQKAQADANKPCNLHEYVVYTNVNKYLGWLRSHIVESTRHRRIQ